MRGARTLVGAFPEPLLTVPPAAQHVNPAAPSRAPLTGIARADNTGVKAQRGRADTRVRAYEPTGGEPPPPFRGDARHVQRLRDGTRGRAVFTTAAAPPSTGVAAA